MAENAVNPSAMTVEEASAMLRTDPETIRRHLAKGLPADGLGRIHLVEYTAWLARELGT